MAFILSQGAWFDAYEIQGTESQIDQVILAIERGTYVHIENMDVRTIPLVEGEHGFRAVAY